MSVCHSCFCAPGYYRAALFLTGRRFRNASGVTNQAKPGAYRTKPEVVISKPGLVNPKPGLVKPKPGLVEARPAFGEGGGAVGIFRERNMADYYIYIRISAFEKYRSNLQQEMFSSDFQNIWS